MSRGGTQGGGALAYLRSALFAGWIFGSAIVLGVLCLPLMLAPRRWAIRPIQAWAHGVFWALRVLVGARVEVRGRERLPRGAPGYLIAAKHQSMLDTLVAMTLTPWPCIVLKRELMLIPIFGWYAWKSGMIALDRKGGPGDVRQLLAAARKALAEGRQVVIYPEGTRRAPGAEPAYKGGIGLLYKELGVACVPCATDGGRVWPAHGLLKHPGRAVFEVLPAIAPGLARKAFMARLEAEVEGAARCLEADLKTGYWKGGGRSDLFLRHREMRTEVMSEITLLRGSTVKAQPVGGRECLVMPAGPAGTVAFGPYEDRKPGRYRVEFEVGRVPGEWPIGDPIVATIDVVANRGVTLLSEARLLFSHLSEGLTKFSLEFDLQEKRSIEYRVMASGKASLCCSERVRVERLGDTSRLAKPTTLEQSAWRNEREFLDGYLRNVKGLIHVGANMGQERRYYWLLGLDVIWIEPIEEVYTILVDHVSKYPRQKALRALLTDRCDEPVAFRIANNAGASSSILPMQDYSAIFPSIEYTEERTIRSTTLSAIVHEQDIPLEHYEALTLDVEGAEKMVLEGGREILSRFKYVKCEVTDFPSRTGTPTVAELDALLSAAGFQELGRRAFTDGPDGRGTAWDIVWKRVAAGERLHEPGYRLPLTFDPLEVDAVEKCE